MNKKAYIGAGTGATIIGNILPLLATVFAVITAFLVKHFWRPIKKWFKKKKSPSFPVEK